VPVCSQPAQAVTGKETFTGVKAVGAYINDHTVKKRAHDHMDVGIRIILGTVKNNKTEK